MVNTTTVRLGKVERQSFSKINEALEMPNLIEIQKNSYKWFLEEGIREVFKDISPITDANGKLALTFVDYHMDESPKYTISECKDRDTTFSAPMKVKVRLRVEERDTVIEKDDIYMGDFPIMTPSGTFIINGAERVIVSQLVRSPGVYYGFDYDKTGKKLFKATVIPNRGAWLELEMDSSDIFYVRIDKNRKIPATAFIRALGKGTEEEIKALFGENDEVINQTVLKDGLRSVEDGLVEVYKKLRPGEPPTVDSAQNHLNSLFFDARRYDLSRFGRYKYNLKLAISSRLINQVSAEDIFDESTGELICEKGVRITAEKAREIEQAGVQRVVISGEELKETINTETGNANVNTDTSDVIVIGNRMVDIKPYLPDSVTDGNNVKLDRDAIFIKLYKAGINEKVLFPVLKELIDEAETDEDLVNSLLRNVDRLVPKHITLEDVFALFSYYLNLNREVGITDDIDHLGNRRIRSVGELLQNQFRIGFARMERVIRERMGTQAQDTEDISPASLINIRPVLAAVKEFFGSSPLSQFMDQNNPLAALTHKRRLSALGPGGLSRDRAGFEVRDVHYSHYGRMCPIETPEGPNIGLISYLASFARINKYGFIEAPYMKVDKTTGRVTKEVVYMTADVEDLYTVAQANEPLDEDGHFVHTRVTGRHRDEILEVPREKVDYMDVSPKMVVSVATAMIPFLENDDANRALMGANMQRQAVPLMITENPIVSTGMEHKAAVDSGDVVLAEEEGTVTFVSADEIVITDLFGKAHSYHLIKFKRSNQGTCVNQRPVVDKGAHVTAGDVLADGPATCQGEISLGKNALIGFMTWEGYNYEDAVLINEKLVYNDVFTSIHIEEYELECRDTKLGPEEITRDIPNLGDDALKDLDIRGIIRIGAEVQSGDIMVGKVTPKGETELTAEERLLRAIFGEKAREVRDNSLKVPHGESGIIVDVKVFTRENCDELSPGVNQVVRCYIAQKRKISVGDKMAGRHGNKGVVSRILPQEDMPFLSDGTPLDIVLNPLGVPSRMNIGQVLEVHMGYAAKALGCKIMTPVFDGAHETDIQEWLKKAGLPETAKTPLIDGRTGEAFDSPVTVGYMYYLKLHHLVDDKIHARSTGPYSLVTQQPLGGKAQFGGQRFGEMEVWALEAYGAAYTLQEILTVKSDDIVGRVKTYESIVKGEPVPRAGVPESFKVLIKELQSLALNVLVLDEFGGEIDLKQTFEDEESGGVVNADDFDYVPNETVAEGDLDKSLTVGDVEGSDFFVDDEEDDLAVADLDDLDDLDIDKAAGLVEVETDDDIDDFKISVNVPDVVEDDLTELSGDSIKNFVDPDTLDENM